MTPASQTLLKRMKTKWQTCNYKSWEYTSLNVTSYKTLTFLASAQLGCSVQGVGFVGAGWQLRQVFAETEKGGIICTRIYSVSNIINYVKGTKKALGNKVQEFFMTFHFQSCQDWQSPQKMERHTKNTLKAFLRQARQTIYVESCLGLQCRM